MINGKKEILDIKWTLFNLITLILTLGKSALHWAAAVNNVDATLVLLKNGANRDMQDNKVLVHVYLFMCMFNHFSSTPMFCESAKHFSFVCSVM